MPFSVFQGRLKKSLEERGAARVFFPDAIDVEGAGKRNGTKKKGQKSGTAIKRSGGDVRLHLEQEGPIQPWKKKTDQTQVGQKMQKWQSDCSGEKGGGALKAEGGSMSKKMPRSAELKKNHSGFQSSRLKRQFGGDTWKSGDDGKRATRSTIQKIPICNLKLQTVGKADIAKDSRLSENRKNPRETKSRAGLVVGGEDLSSVIGFWGKILMVERKSRKKKGKNKA